MSVINSYETPWLYETEPPSLPISSLASEGVIISHTFPTSVNQNADLPWSADVHNVGTEGQIAVGIVNVAGNPGNIVLTFQGSETVIAPNQYFRVYTSSPIPNCTHLIENGMVRFESVGNYVVKLWGMWYDEITGQWTYNSTEEITKNVNVTQAGGVIKQVHILDNVKLKAESWEIVKSITRIVTNVDMNVLIGGKLDYTISYTRGNEPITTARIFWNNIEYVDVNLTLGQNQTGSIDVTGLINTGNDLMVQIESAPLFWAEVNFDIWLTLEFSEPPSSDPTTPFNWEEIIGKYGKWIALGTVGVVVLFMMKRPSIIVVGGKQ